MSIRQQKNTKNKPNSKGLHSKNLHNHGYDFSALSKTYSPLSPYVNANIYGDQSIDFAKPSAVKALNAALLKHYYHIVEWDIPNGALCPPIPGRADYIHYIAELLGISDEVTTADTTPAINMLDIGIGANGIYSLLACQIYGWHCIGSDINAQSLDNVAAIIASNPQLKGSISLRQQSDSNLIFKGVIKPDEFYDVTVCNPPFHASAAEALKGSQRKVANLARNRADKTLKTQTTNAKLSAIASAGTGENKSTSLNFGGQAAELWCNGGERLFLKKMVKESQTFSAQCRWFTSLVSKADNVKPMIKLIKKLGATHVKEIEMVQGNKITRIVAWTYF